LKLSGSAWGKLVRVLRGVLNSAMDSPKKIYLMSPAASGKSTFAGKHGYYRGYKVVDSAQLMPEANGVVKLILYFARVFPQVKRLVRNNPIVQSNSPSQYYAKVLEYMRSESEPVVMLGRRGPVDLRPCGDIVFGVVQIPWKQHQLNCQRRRSQLRNPLPFFHHWTTDTRKIESARVLFLEYAERHNLRLFDSFANAIDELSRGTPQGCGNERKRRSTKEV